MANEGNNSNSVAIVALIIINLGGLIGITDDDPMWTAPVNTTGSAQTCTIQVDVS